MQQRPSRSHSFADDLNLLEHRFGCVALRADLRAPWFGAGLRRQIFELFVTLLGFQAKRFELRAALV